MTTNPNTAPYWDARYTSMGRTAAALRARLSSHAALYSTVAGLIPPEARVVLDVGGGPGVLLEAYLEQWGRPQRWVNLDFSAEAGGGFREQFRELEKDGRVSFYQGDLDDPGTLPGVAAVHGPFDAIVCCEVLEHLSDDVATARAIRRLLGPGGGAVVSVPTRPGIASHLRHYGDSQNLTRLVQAFYPTASVALHPVDRRWVVVEVRT